MGFYRGANVVTDGLVLSLDAANPKSYVSGSTTWYDLSGNNYSGSLVNGPTFSSANCGTIVFDGVDDIVNLPFINYPTSSNTTIEMVIKIDELNLRTPTSAQLAYITSSNVGRFDAYTFRPISVNNSIPEVSFFTSAYPSGSVSPSVRGRYEFIFRILDNSVNNYPLVFQDSYDPTTGVLISQTTNFTEMLPGSYFHYVWSVNNTVGSRSVLHYVNGSRITNLLGNPPNGDFSFFQKNNLRLGGKNSIPIFRLYTKALSDAEILQNYNATKARFGL